MSKSASVRSAGGEVPPSEFPDAQVVGPESRQSEDPTPAPEIPQRFPLGSESWAFAARRRHGVQSELIHVVIEFDGHLDQKLLRRAARLLLDAEPVLGCLLHTENDAPYWERLDFAQEPDIVRIVSTQQEYDTVLYASVDTSTGPPVLVALWPREQGDRLLFKTTHDAGDMGAVHTSVARLAEIYTKLSIDPRYQPIPNLGRRDYGLVTELIPRRAYPRIAWNLVRDISGVLVFPSAHHVPVPGGPDKPWCYVTRAINPERGRRLSAYAKERGATLNDLLLAATYRAFAAVGDWNGRTSLRIPVTIDLRRWYLRPEDKVGLCTLSGLEFPFLGRTLGADLAETLGRVNKLMTNRKKHWIGMTTALVVPWTTRRAGYRRVDRRFEMHSHRPRSERGRVGFSNMGRFEPEGISFGAQTPASAYGLVMPRAAPAMLMGFTGYRGGLTLSFGTPEHNRPTVDKLLDAILTELPD